MSWRSRRKRTPSRPSVTTAAYSSTTTPWRHYTKQPSGTWEHFERFATLTSCVEVAKAHKNNHENDTYFAGGTLAEAVQWATYGWPEGASKATTMASRIANRILQTRAGDGIDMCPNVSGAVYDVGGYLSGVPECWIQPVPGQPKRAICIGYNICASAGVSADTLMARGMAVLALAIALNAKGYPITVDICQTTCQRTYGGGIAACFVTRVADASSGSQLDVDRLAFALGHPTMFRQLYACVTGEAWGSCVPDSDNFPTDAEYDVKIGGAHLDEVERWRDGGEAWVLNEYNKQTAEG